MARRCLFFFMFAIACSQQRVLAQEVTTVPQVELGRYVGKWYEIARLPNKFQAACVSDVTAEYTLKADGEIKVVNTCRKTDGTLDTVNGIAKVNDQITLAKLKVRFAPEWLSWLPLVWGDYWVIDLAPDYSVSVVGEPGRDYLWILSRTPTLSNAVYQEVTARATAQGFDTARLIKTKQDGQ